MTEGKFTEVGESLLPQELSPPKQPLATRPEEVKQDNPPLIEPTIDQSEIISPAAPVVAELTVVEPEVPAPGRSEAVFTSLSPEASTVKLQEQILTSMERNINPDE